MAKWFEKHRGRWAIEKSIAQQFLEGVVLGNDKDDRVYIEGTLPLRLESGHVLDHFRLKIVYPHRFLQRRCHPDIYLVSHRDQWKCYPEAPSGHLESDWRMCLFVPLESGLDFNRENELQALLGHVATYLVRQRIYQRDLQAENDGGAKAKWPGPDRGHGSKGLLQAIKDSGKKLGRNDDCVCGSGHKFKHCHYKNLHGQMLVERRGELVKKRKQT